jgi:hypothetical protein
MICLACFVKGKKLHTCSLIVWWKRAWECISGVIGREIGANYESIAMMWLCNKRFGITNVLTTAVCWGVWKLRNCFCFQDVKWLGMKQLWHRV